MNSIILIQIFSLQPAQEPSTDRNENLTNFGPPMDPTKTILQYLNDDCLIKLFEHLRLSDLCSVADVCQRFASIAVTVFKRHHVALDLNDILDDFYRLDDSYALDRWESMTSLNSLDIDLASRVPPEPMETVERLFRRFGIYIQQICIRLYNDDEEQKNEIFQLMSTYCLQKDAKLNRLILYDTTISEETCKRFQPLFDHLSSLDVTGGTVSFDIGTELTELKLEDVFLKGIATTKLNKLQELSLVDIKGNCFGRRGPCQMSTLLLPHLKRLTIIGECFHMFNDNLILCAGVTQLLELEELKLDVEFDPRNMENVRNLARLRHLKVFDLNCRWYSITELLKNFVEQKVPIEELHLRKFLIESTSATYISKLNTIKKLCLSDGGWNFGPETTRLANMVKGMPLLEKLYLCDFGSITMTALTTTIANTPKLSELHLDFGPPLDENFIIHEEEFIEICEIIAKRLVYTQLNMIISGNESKLAVRDDIIKTNRVWLDVQIISNGIHIDIEPDDLNDSGDGPGFRETGIFISYT